MIVKRHFASECPIKYKYAMWVKLRNKVVPNNLLGRNTSISAYSKCRRDILTEFGNKVSNLHHLIIINKNVHMQT